MLGFCVYSRDTAQGTRSADLPYSPPPWHRNPTDVKVRRLAGVNKMDTTPQFTLRRYVFPFPPGDESLDAATLLPPPILTGMTRLRKGFCPDMTPESVINKLFVSLLPSISVLKIKK